MTVDRLAEILLGVLTLIVGYSSFWLATRSTHAQGRAAVRAVDAAAYERARQIYEGALDTLREDLTATRGDLATTRSDLATTRNDLVTARREIGSLRREILGLRRKVEELGGDPDARRADESQ